MERAADLNQATLNLLPQVTGTLRQDHRQRLLELYGAQWFLRAWLELHRTDWIY